MGGESKHEAPPPRSDDCRVAIVTVLPARPKAPYAPPSLTRYGTVRELTKGGNGTNQDGSSSHNTHK
jgi:hypothetical protein